MPHSRVINFAPIGSISTSARVKEPAQPAKALYSSQREEETPSTSCSSSAAVFAPKRDRIAEVKDRQSRHDSHDSRSMTQMPSPVLSSIIMLFSFVYRCACYARRWQLAEAFMRSVAAAPSAWSRKTPSHPKRFQPSFRIRLRRL